MFISTAAEEMQEGDQGLPSPVCEAEYAQQEGEAVPVAHQSSVPRQLVGIALCSALTVAIAYVAVTTYNNWSSI